MVHELATLYNRSISYRGWLAFEKLDGVRAHWDGFENLRTRGGTLLNPPPFFLAQLPQGHCLDGELWAGRRNFQQVVKIVKNVTCDSGWHALTFKVFDIVTNEKLRSLKFTDRLQQLAEAVANPSISSGISIVQPLGVVGEDESWVDERMREICRLGGEGLILRDPEAVHVAGRSNGLVKVKMEQDEEGLVVGYTEGRNAQLSRIGALIVRDNRGKEFRVGSGLDVLARIDPPPIGATIQYSFRQRTDSGLPRHATYVRIVSIT